MSALETAKRTTICPPAGAITNFADHWPIHLCTIALAIHGFSQEEAAEIASSYTGDADTRYARIVEDYGLSDDD